MRDNETTRLAAILEHLRAGERAAAIEALMRLWSERPERQGRDEAAAEAWQAIRAAGAIDDAVAAGLALIRAGTKIRLHAYVDLTEQLSEPQLGELVDLVLSSALPVDPYLAAVFVRFAEHNYRKAFTAVLARHAARIAADPEVWDLALWVMSTSLIGDSATVANWFAERGDRPLRMSTVAAYIATVFQLDGAVGDVTSKNLRTVVAIGREAYARVEWDESAALIVCLRLIGFLHEERLDDFLGKLREHRPMLLAALEAPLIEHPIIAFANRLKHSYPVTQFQLDHPREVVPGAPVETRLRNRQLVEVARDLAAVVRLAIEVFDMVEAMALTDRGDTRAYELVGQMSNHPGQWWINTAWSRLVRARTSRLGRFVRGV